MGHDAARVTAKETDAIRLRRSGLTYDQIAKTVGYSDGRSAWVAVKRGMTKALREASDDLREFEAQRLDTAMAAIWDDVLAGDRSAIMCLVKLIQERAKLFGLYAPTTIKQEITVYEGGSELDREVQRLAEFLASNDTNTGPDSGSIQTVVGNAVSTT
jgi:hypothetical protein